MRLGTKYHLRGNSDSPVFEVVEILADQGKGADVILMNKTNKRPVHYSAANMNIVFEEITSD